MTSFHNDEPRRSLKGRLKRTPTVQVKDRLTENKDTILYSDRTANATRYSSNCSNNPLWSNQCIPFLLPPGCKYKEMSTNAYSYI